MTATRVGYARCSTDKQDLAAQQAILTELGVAPERIYMDRGLTGTTRARPGLDQALAAVPAGDTLVVPKLDRLARSVPDARQIADALVARGVKLALGTSVYDPTDPMGKMFQIPSDLVVKFQTIDIVEVVFSLIWRRNIAQTSCRNRKTRFELPSPLEAHWSTTKSGGMWLFPLDPDA